MNTIQMAHIKRLIEENKRTVLATECAGGECAQRRYESAAASIERLTRWLDTKGNER